MGAKKTIVSLLDAEDVRALLSFYLIEVKKNTAKWEGLERPWNSKEEMNVRRLLKKAAECAERLDELEKQAT